MASVPAARAAVVAGVDPPSQTFVLPDGRTALFHGLNAVYKLAPFVPCWDCAFDPRLSLNAADIRTMRALGVTVVRLGVMVEAVLPDALGGAVNTTYLSEMVKLSERLGQAGIFTLVDAHQDLLSRSFCGEGFPSRLVTPPNVSAAERFPAPLPVTIHTDPSTGFPNVTECEAVPFALFNAAAEVNAAWGLVYNNATVRRAVATHWSAVAAAFRASAVAPGSPLRLLGYELLNEPIPYPITLATEPGASDRTNLAPLYSQLNDALRASDPDGIVFFEPAVTNMLLGQVPGFTSGPGGPGADARQAMALHIYCNALNHTGDVVNVTACDHTVTTQFDLAARSFAGVTGGRMLTEFGAVGGTAGDAHVITALLDRCDDASLSWAYWNFKPFHDVTTVNAASEGLFDDDGAVQSRKAAALARSYPHLLPAAAGAPSSFRFDASSPFRELIVDYTVGSATPHPAEPSYRAELFGSAEHHYKGGANVTVDPHGAGTVTMETGPDGSWTGWVWVDHEASAAGLAVRVTMRAVVPQGDAPPAELR